VNDRLLRLSTTVLAVAGAAVAAYLVVERYTGGTISCTSGGGGCETVQQSRYALLAGIPVAVHGLAGYLAMLVLSLFRSAAAQAALLAVGLAAWAFSVYLLYAQAFLIGAFCDWCLASDAILTVLVAVSLMRLRGRPAPTLDPVT
jgi:uncharacterized membrane protein